jgi:RHH-type proline utilization regulon transcriptional repressor/proline dehydrogenase/delta 1-pyrroline-5-carboxylate dehydrogenase
MVRLVKGAYWDSEIKRAQVDGLDGFPVFTRKAYTDVSYLACARKLLDAPDAVFPQFATHNAQTLSAIMAMAPGEFHAGQYEFQCLHGMGEPLYEEVVGRAKLDRPCRIYAPVGTHETLLAYLVRRLLENGANSSFVNRIADPAVPVADLTIDPVALVRARYPGCLPHPGIAAPRALYAPERQNSAGLDLSNEQTLATLADALSSVQATWGEGRIILNPADHRDVVGTVDDATEAEIGAMIARAAEAAEAWGRTPVGDRAVCLARAADLLEAQMPVLLGLIVREAGKTLPNAVGEVREAVDFLRYYAAEAVRSLAESTPLGPVACISPWNFPLAIFMGQVSAALAAGNTVLAKPAEETPLIAIAAVRLLHEAGIPEAVVQLVQGDGAVGAALVADARVQGVVFTGSTAVAKAIQRQLARRLTAGGMPVPLIAETGGQNAMIVDSSALAEQVVGDVIASAFDSAGQRCSALRILCLQEDIAERTLTMLKRAMRELEIGRPDRLEVDVGPVISAEALAGVREHVEGMRARGFAVEALPLPEGTEHGTFMAPTLIEITAVSDVEREVFGPVLHVLRFKRERLDALVDAINATGYALTFGLHTRIDETAARVTKRINAGNIYVNRNIIGAVVGSQPFGGSGLSGTGPKAGGPLYLRRLVASAPPMGAVEEVLPGPAGEENLYRLEPRGLIAAIASTEAALSEQVALIEATGNRALVAQGLPPDVRGVLFEGDRDALLALTAQLAERPGPIIMVQARGAAGYRAEWLMEERCISTNTAAAGGNASLMAMA